MVEEQEGMATANKDEKIEAYLKRIDRLMDFLVRRLHVELEQHLVTGVTASQFIILKKITDRERVTVSELAGDLYVSLSAVTSQVDRMYRAGLVDRHRDGEDRRVVWLELTSKGEEVYKACQESRLKTFGKYLKQLSEQDIEKLLDIYERLLVIIESDAETD